MRSLSELLDYYAGVGMAYRATTELSLPTGDRRICIKDEHRRLDSALLYDADRLSKAALVSFLACNQLRCGGYASWGAISLYYSRFQTISALLRLVGLAVIGQRLLCRTDEVNHLYLLVKRNAPEAEASGFGGGGSHREQWRMFTRTFKEWADDEAPGEAASVLGEDSEYSGGRIPYDFAVDERNNVNYLKSDAGVFFPETDFSGMQDYWIQDAKLSGAWDCLRTDEHPFGDYDPPEAYFFQEMLTWDLLKFAITALVKSQGHTLLGQYLWLIDNLESHSDLQQHVREDIEHLI